MTTRCPAGQQNYDAWHSLAFTDGEQEAWQQAIAHERDCVQCLRYLLANTDAVFVAARKETQRRIDELEDAEE